MKYKSYLRNHAVYPDSKKALHTFLNATLDRNGKQEKHKLKHCLSPNSEDALTWSWTYCGINRRKESYRH